MSAIRVFALIAASSAMVAIAPAMAQSLSHAKNVCVGDRFGRKPPLELGVETFSFPVGCELVDCCPGCPADAPVDVKVKVSGNGIRSAEIQFNAGVGKARPLPLSGAWASFKGIPVTMSGKTVIGEARVTPDFAYLRKAAGKAGKQGRALATARVEITQTVGAYTVQENRFAVAFRSCGHSPAKPREDEIRLRQRLADREVAITLTDARQDISIIDAPGRPPIRASTCVNDWLARNGGSAGVGNLLERQGCNSEVSVFSRRSEFHLEPNVTVWTSGWDILDLTMRPPIALPITIWLVATGARPKAELDVAEANRIFTQYRAGFRLAPTYKEQTVVLPVNLCTVGGSTTDFVGTELNAYYIDDITVAGGVGLHCGPIFVESGYAGHRVLAHEVGHALGLTHYRTAESGDPYPEMNLMWWDADRGGERLTLGQVFRANLDPASALNRLVDVRIGPTRECSWMASNICPSLGLTAGD